jgi:hypothetical protein
MKVLADRGSPVFAEGANGVGIPLSARPHFGPPAQSVARGLVHGPRAAIGGPLPREAHWLVTGLKGRDFVRIERKTVGGALEAVTRLRELGWKIYVQRIARAA